MPARTRFRQHNPTGRQHCRPDGGSNGRILEFELSCNRSGLIPGASANDLVLSDAKKSASDTILSSAGSIPTAFHFNFSRDSQNNLLGGFSVSAYRSQYAIDPSGAAAIPLRIHPMLPPGTFYFDISDNPYPSSRLPFVRGMLVQRDYYSIEWPLVTRQWTFGTYCHEVLSVVRTMDHHCPDGHHRDLKTLQ